MKQKFMLILTLMLGIGNAWAQENLLPNGNFEEGNKGWSLRVYEVSNDGGIDGSKCISLGYLNQYRDFPSAKTLNWEVGDVAGKTLLISFWGKGIDASHDVSIRFNAKDSLNKNVYNMEGTNNNVLNKFIVGENKNNWIKYTCEFNVPRNISKLTGVEVVVRQSYVKIDDVSVIFKAPAAVAPKGFATTEVSQRNATLTWEQVQGKEYKISVGDQNYDVTNTNTLVLDNLVPGKEYTASIATKDKPDLKSEVKFTTQAVAEGAIPYLANVENGITKTFKYNVVDLSGGKITAIKIQFNGTDASVGENGNVTLPSFDQGDLKVTITQEDNKVTKLTYYNLNLKK